MASTGTVVESTSSGSIAIKLSPGHKLSGYTAYRHVSAGPQIAYAAGLFYQNRSKYTYKHGHWRSRQKVTASMITDPDKSHRTISCVGVCEGCINYATDLKVVLNSPEYGEKYQPSHYKGFSRLGSATSVTLQPGDILVSSGHHMVYVGDTVKKSGSISNGGQLSKVKAASTQDVITGAVEWAKMIAADNSFHYGYGEAAHHNGCYFCDTQPAVKKNAGIKEYKKTYCCNPFIHAAWAHGGGDPAALKKCQAGSSWDFHAGSGYDTCDRFQKLNIKSESDLKPGDVLCRDTHVAMYIGNGEIVEAASGDDNVPNSSKWNNSIHTTTLSKKYSGKGLSAFPRRYRYVYDGSFKDFGKLYDGGSALGGNFTTASGVDMSLAIDKLYSSDNYIYLDEENDLTKRRTRDFRTALVSRLNELTVTEKVPVVPDESMITFLDNVSRSDFDLVKPQLNFLRNKASKLLSFNNFVEAPIAIIDFDGVKIGGVGNTGDDYPNYLTSVTTRKINGKVNTYKIVLSYQVRPGEDPNFIDKLISKVGYTKPISLLYGDANASSMYKEESAIITNVSYNEDVSSYRINYTINAISASSVGNAVNRSYPAKEMKPSTAIYELIFQSGETSKYLLGLFPGMKDRSLISSKGLIPTTDAVVSIGAVDDADPVSYLQYLVSCMTSNTNTRSSYFLTFCDDVANDFGGPYFKISEVVSYNNTNTNATDMTINSDFYEVDIGYPSDNFITDFDICNNDYWAQVYEYNDTIPKYQYGIDDEGNILLSKTNRLLSDNKFLDESLISSNWWKQATEFPITAKLTMRGVIRPVILMSYIRVNAQFYGQRDMGSGIYVVIEQNDIVTSRGCVTELTLLRVAGDNVTINFKGR